MKNILIITYIFCLSASAIQAQDELKIKLKDAPKPDIYIDGKKYDYAIFELLDQNKIKSVNVIKHERAIEEYNAPNGVIIIKTKKAEQQAADEIEIKNKNNDKDPLIIIDGKVSDREALSKMSPDTIESIAVYKGEQAIEQYDAPNGAIIVKTKD